jgi:hypothetical protein
MSLIENVVKALNTDKIPYAIVGGVAVALHGAPRGTIDLDIVIKHKAEFFESVETCLKSMGFLPRLPVTAREVFNFRNEYITRRNMIAWSFYNPTNPLEVIDIILTHDLSNMKSVNMKMGLSTLRVLSVQDLIRMKSKSGRPQDLEDIKVLKELTK